MDCSSYLSTGFLYTEEILDLKLVTLTSSEFKAWPNATDKSRLRYNPQKTAGQRTFLIDHAINQN